MKTGTSADGSRSGSAGTRADVVVASDDDTGAGASGGHDLTPLSVQEEKSLMSRIDWRLLPLLNLLYITSYLDRANLGNAHSFLLRDLKMSEYEYSTCSSIFYLTYTLTEVPSNLLLARFGAKAWISRIAISWGVVSALQCLITGYGGLVGMRLLLGLCEAGLFPGVLLYFAYWYPRRERSQRVAIFYMAQVLSGLIGGIASYFITTEMDGLHGLHAWQWLFLLEGAPAAVLGVLTYYYLPDRPDTTNWLSAREKRHLIARIDPHDPVLNEPRYRLAHASGANGDAAGGAVELSATVVHVEPAAAAASVSTIAPTTRSSLLPQQLTSLVTSTQNDDDIDQTAPIAAAAGVDSDSAAPPSAAGDAAAESDAGGASSPASRAAAAAALHSHFPPWPVLKATFGSRLLWSFAIANFCTMIPILSVTFFLPAIIATFLPHAQLTANLLSSIPYCGAAIAMYANSRYSDRTQNRFGSCFWMTLVSCGMFALLAFVVPTADDPGSLPLQMVVITLAASAMWGSKPVLFAWASNVLTGNLPIAIAVVIAVGNGGGTAGPYLMAESKTRTGSYAFGIGMIAVSEFLFALSLIWIRYELKRASAAAAAASKAATATAAGGAGDYSADVRAGLAGPPTQQQTA